MNDYGKTEKQLVEELAELRRRIAALEELRQFEQTSAPSKAILNAVIESLPFDFWAIGLDGRYMMQNSASKKHWGEIIAKRPEDVAETEKDLAVWLYNNRRALAGERVDAEVQLQVQGKTQFYHNVIAPIIADGRIQGILGVNIGISRRKRAEAALRESEQRYRTLTESLQQAHGELEQKVQQRTVDLRKANEELAVFRRFAEASTQGFGMADPEGRIAYVNPAFCRLLGEDKPEDLVGKSFTDYFGDEWRDRRANEVIPILERQGSWKGELLLASRQGNVTPTWQHAFLLRDEGGKLFRRCLVVTDITERKRAEEQLRESEERYRTLVETLPDAVLIADLAGHITFASRRLAEMYGIEDVAEMLGRDPLDFIDKEDHQTFLANLKKAVEQRISRHVEHKLLRKDGTSYPGAISVAVIEDAAGNPIALTALIRDITDQKQAEEALRQSRDELQAIYDSVTDGIEQATEIAVTNNFPRSGKRVRPKTAVKGKRFLCAKCRKRSPKPVKTPAPWYCPTCLKEIEAAKAKATD